MKYYPEIDGFRAIAVLLVIAYHYFPSFAPNGFLGVDIFFVISGFVISGSLFNYSSELTHREIIAKFYAKRFRRILPALIGCALFSTLALVVLTIRPSRDAFLTGGAALFGLSNIVLFEQNADYFALSSQINAFTHTWSLGVEEQFYLIFPLLGLSIGVFGASRRQVSNAALSILLCLALLSFVSYAWMASANSVAAFYLSPFRFWELLIGCIAFLVHQSKYQVTWPKALDSLILAVLAICVFWKADFPVTQVALTCFCTALLLLSITNNGLLGWKIFLNAKPINYIGRISYSLYLYHWPIQVISVVTIGNSPQAFLIALCLSFLLAITSYHLIEIPFRRPSSKRSDSKYIAISLVLSSYVGVFVAIAGPKAAERMPWTVFDSVGVVPHKPWDVIPCHGAVRIAAASDPLSECLGFGPNLLPADIFLLGDSHAAQLTFPLKEITDELGSSLYFINTDREGDFPFIFLAQREAPWGPALSRTLQNVDSGDTLVLAFHRGHLNAKRDMHLDVSADTSPNSKSENLGHNLERLAHELVAREVRLILVLDTPLLSYITQVETCALQVRLWGTTACTVSKQQDLRTRSRQQTSFEAVAAKFENMVTIVDPADVFFANGNNFNPIAEDGSYRMIDWNHLSQREAHLLAPLFRTALSKDQSHR
ncbi:acyltransferase family protein [Roseobacter sp. CCS2]|uniref:acyltransferase family protein n=1 Tax=Roseobacter sp. CCS2 TaxID=391593 RepID=UPI0000F3F0BB|nr:acyltransferase family protein [Roseobacter sp. CCS2]EBA11217.1 Predicted membrane associated acyltransferase [Roseobacter sp. CCS2]